MTQCHLKCCACTCAWSRHSDLLKTWSSKTRRGWPQSYPKIRCALPHTGAFLSGILRRVGHASSINTDPGSCVTQSWCSRMDKMQSRQSDEKKGIPAPDGCFLMWHDYMDLRRTLSELFKGESDGDAARRDRGVVKPRPRSQGIGSAGSSVSSNPDQRNSRDTCGFCKQNGESLEIYTSHRLKSRDGQVMCPILRNYVCPFCSATGDRAHTRQYCPVRNKHHHMKEHWEAVCFRCQHVSLCGSVSDVFI